MNEDNKGVNVSTEGKLVWTDTLCTIAENGSEAGGVLASLSIEADGEVGVVVGLMDSSDDVASVIEDISAGEDDISG